MLDVGLDALALPVHLVDQVEKLGIGGLLHLLVTIGGLFGDFRRADWVKLSLLYRKVHCHKAQSNLDLPLEVGLLPANKSPQVLLQKNLEHLDRTRMARDQLNHGSSELGVADLPAAKVHGLKALNA